jgi:type IV pilus assembly protein PilQ
MRYKHSVVLLFILLYSSFRGIAQDRFEIIESNMHELAKQTPGMYEKVELSVNGISLQEFISGLATSNNLNVSVGKDLNDKIYNNFSNVNVMDVLLFLCKKYDLDVTFISNIMSFSKFAQPPAIAAGYKPKIIKITYDSVNNKLSLDLNGDSLSLVTKRITQLSKKNVVFSPDLAGKLLSGYMGNTPFDNALEKLAFANDLKVTPTSDNFYLIEKSSPTATAGNKFATSNKTQKGKGSYPGIHIQSDGKQLSVDAQDTPILDLVKAVSNELNIEFFLFSDLKGTASLNIANVSFDEFLKKLFNATEYTFRKEGNLYLLGERTIEGLRVTKVFQLQYRTVEKIIDLIPLELKKTIEIKPFPDLNSLILCGSQPRITELESFLRDIDKVVPNISIEVIIVDISESHTVSTGIEAGLGTAPVNTGGTVFPAPNITLSSSALNEIITGINGFGVVNLGHVTPNFYMTLRALEVQGSLKIRSTPKVSTINGHEAKMAISTTEYYLEQTTNLVVAQVSQNVTTTVYKPVNAELSVTINPIVSGDEQVTLDITVKQSSFTARISPTAPPGNISRDLKSLIRVKNGEMIMIGGLEESSTTESGTGTPVLSRIPILKWFFSSRTKAKSKSKLTIFIKPTVIY